MKISVIIPIYNVEQYIERCLRSVLAQTYRNIEVILVDDCTPDASIEVANAVIKNAGMNDIVTKFLHHNRNRGLSAARNTGIEAAKGEYVYFLDSDDEISPECIELLVTPLQKERYDFVIGDFKTTGTDRTLHRLDIKGKELNVLQAYVERRWYPMAVNKLVNLRFLKENNLYFKERFIHEDELWSFQLACMAKSMFAVKKQTYIYHIRQGSIMTKETSKEYIEWRFRIAPMMWKYIDAHGLSEDMAANNIIEAFLQSAHPIFIISKRMEGYQYYKRIRIMNIRPNCIYRRMAFSSLTGFIKYSHYLMPIPLGFWFKVMMRLVNGKKR